MRSTDNTKEQEIRLWHWWWVHSSFGYMKYLFSDISISINVATMKCETSILTKTHQIHHPISSNKCNIPFALLHSVVGGPEPIISSMGINWFVIFINDYTHMIWLYLLKQKKWSARHFQIILYNDLYSIFNYNQGSLI